MLSWKIRLLILLFVASPLPTLALIGYETWAQYQLPFHLLIEKGLNKLIPGQTDSPISDSQLPSSQLSNSQQAIEASPAAYNLWGANAGKQPSPDQQNRRHIPVNSVPALRRAIATALPGDRIELLPGSYLIEDNKISITHAGIQNAPIRVMAKQLGQVKLKLNTTAGFWLDAPYWVFENLDIEGVCASHSQCEHAFHIVGRADHTTLQNNRIYNFNAAVKGNGIGAGAARDFPDDVLIQGNRFFNTRIRDTANPVTLIDVVGGDRWTLRQNLIADFSKGGSDQISYGAFLKGNGSDGLIEQNLVICEMELPADQGVRIGLSLGGGGSDDWACQTGSCATEHRNGVIRNNIIMDCSKDVGIYLNRASNALVAHNTLSHTLGIDVRFDSSSANMINNLMNGRLLARDNGTYSAQHNLLIQTPLIDRQNFMHWLASRASLLLPEKLRPLVIAKGLPIKTINTDFCGNQRIKKLPDIGALEFDRTATCLNYRPETDVLF